MVNTYRCQTNQLKATWCNVLSLVIFSTLSFPATAAEAETANTSAGSFQAISPAIKSATTWLLIMAWECQLSSCFFFCWGFGGTNQAWKWGIGIRSIFTHGLASINKAARDNSHSATWGFRAVHGPDNQLPVWSDRLKQILQWWGWWDPYLLERHAAFLLLRALNLVNGFLWALLCFGNYITAQINQKPQSKGDIRSEPPSCHRSTATGINRISSCRSIPSLAGSGEYVTSATKCWDWIEAIDCHLSSNLGLFENKRIFQLLQGDVPEKLENSWLLICIYYFFFCL